MKRSAVELLRIAALAGQTEIVSGFLRRISRALRIVPLALCVALMAAPALAETVCYFSGGTRNAQNAYTKGPYISTGKIYNLSDSLSMSAWVRVSPTITTVKPAGQANFSATIAGQGYYSAEKGFGFQTMGFNDTATGNDYLGYYVRIASGNPAMTSDWYDDTTLFTADEWHHYLLVRDKTAGKTRFYVDGKLFSEKDCPSSWDIINDKSRYFMIAYNKREYGGTFCGYIADLALWNVALSATDAARLPFVGPEKVSTAPYAYFPLDEGSGNSVKEILGSTTNNYTAAGNGTLQWEDDPNFVRSSTSPVGRLNVTASVDGVGSPSPSYGITNGIAAGDSFTVSCGETPVMDAVGRTQYSCTGWKLYDESNAVVSNGTETSFTYIHPTLDVYRQLEWQWEATASFSVTQYNKPVNGGSDYTAAATCLAGNPGNWTNSVGESAAQFITNDLYVVSGGQQLYMGQNARTFAGGTMRFGNNGTAGTLRHEGYYSISFPYGLVLERGSYNVSFSSAANIVRIGGVLNGGKVTVTASEDNPFSVYASWQNCIVVINNDLATESSSNVLSFGGTVTNTTYYVMGDLSGYTGRIVVNYTGTADLQWATRLCLGERTMPGTIQVKGKTAISARSGVLTNPASSATFPTYSPSVCTIGSFEMESGSVICVEGSNKTSTEPATNGLIRVSSAFSASRPVYVKPNWAVEVTKENPEVTVLTVPSSQRLSRADFTLDTTGLTLSQELVLDVRSEGPVKKLVITKKKKGLTIILR